MKNFRVPIGLLFITVMLIVGASCGAPQLTPPSNAPSSSPANPISTNSSPSSSTLPATINTTPSVGSPPQPPVIGKSIWMFPLPPGLPQPRLLTQDEKDVVMRLAGNAPELAAQKYRGFYSTELMWFGYTGESSPYYQHTFGVYYSEFEKGTYQQGSLPPGQYYPGIENRR
jgi:hypothetical protein